MKRSNKTILSICVPGNAGHEPLGYIGIGNGSPAIGGGGLGYIGIGNGGPGTPKGEGPLGFIGIGNSGPLPPFGYIGIGNGITVPPALGFVGIGNGGPVPPTGFIGIGNGGRLGGAGPVLTAAATQGGAQDRTDAPAETDPILSVGIGNHRDTPDHRDVSPETMERAPESHREFIRRRVFSSRPGASSTLDLAQPVHKQWPVRYQGPLHSCTAHAVIALVQYLVLRAHGEQQELSHLFLYKTTRRLLGWHGDSGATLRSTLKALKTFGLPPEAWHPYDPIRYEALPDTLLFSFVQYYAGIHYVRLDGPRPAQTDLCEQIKHTLRNGYPVTAGIMIHDGVTMDATIPLPTDKNRLLGGHAVLLVGYDDHHGSKGAFKFRNSWGPEWGDKGYGYLPYEHVTAGLAHDFWTIVNLKWANQDQ